MLPIRYLLQYCFLFLILLPCFAYAQPIQTSLPDPIVDINFGNGVPEVGTAITGGNTDFTFTADECPGPGAYSIIRNNNLCTNGKPANGYDVIQRDHTFKLNNTAYNGYFMIVNGKGQPPGKVYFSTTVNNLCANSTYLFTSGSQTAGACGSNYVSPNLLYRVETPGGQVLAENTGPVYYTNIFAGGTFFDLPAGETSVVLKLISGGTSGSCGTYISIDDIQLRPTGPDITAAVKNGTGWVGSLCAANHPTIDLTSSLGTSFVNPLMQWQTSTDQGVSWTDIPGANTPDYSITFTTPDTFLFRTRAAESPKFANKFCNVVSNWVKINIDGPPNVQVTTNSPVCSGESIELRVENFASATWTGPNGFSQSVPYPVKFHALLADSGTYYATATTLGGCTGNGSAYVVMKGKDVSVGGDTLVCNGTTVPLYASGALTYSWAPAEGLSDPGISHPFATPAVSTTYQLTAVDADACVHHEPVTVTLKNKIAVKAVITAPEFICRPVDTVTFINNSSGNLTFYHWNLANGLNSEQASPSTQTYRSSPNVKDYAIQLIIHDSTGCADTAVHILQVANNCFIAVPSAFSPNGDGKNDFLYPANAYKATHLLFKVFNRYGQLVFQSKDWTQKWDGRYKGAMQPTGAFVWMLWYTDASKKPVFLKGSTLLIR